MKKSGHQLANENEAKYGVILSVLRKKPTASQAEIKSNPAWKWETSPSGPSIGKAKQELGIWRQNGKAKVKVNAALAVAVPDSDFAASIVRQMRAAENLIASVGNVERAIELLKAIAETPSSQAE